MTKTLYIFKNTVLWAELYLPKRYVQVLTLGMHECNLIVIQLKWSHRVDPKQVWLVESGPVHPKFASSIPGQGIYLGSRFYVWCLNKRNGRDIDTPARKNAMWRQSRDWSYAATSQGTPGSTRSWKRPGSIPPRPRRLWRKPGPTNILILDS